MNKHMKKYSESLVIRKIQIDTTVSYYYTSVRMTETQDWQFSAVEDVALELIHCRWQYYFIELI